MKSYLRSVVQKKPLKRKSVWARLIGVVSEQNPVPVHKSVIASLHQAVLSIWPNFDRVYVKKRLVESDVINIHIGNVRTFGA